MRRAAVIVDSSVWIDGLQGLTFTAVDRAVAEGTLILSPLAVAEVLSGNITPEQRAMVGELLQDFAVHPTPLEHWINVGNLRRMLRAKGINATIPDENIAQCAIDLGATLLTRDEIFTRIAAHTSLRLGQLR